MTKSAALLSDFCDLISLQVDPATMPESPYLGLEHLEPARLRAIGFGKASDATSQKAAFEPGDVLYGKLRPYLDKAVLADRAGVATTELLVLRPKLGVSPEYLACVVHSPAFIEFAMQGVTGAQHPRTSWAHIRTFELPAHDRSEQASIAKLLWSLFDLSMATGQGITSASSLKRAAMQQLFSRGLRGETQKETEIGQIPESWELVPMGELGRIGNGSTPKRSTGAYWDGGTFPWLNSAKVYDRDIRDADQFVTAVALKECHLPVLEPGAVLVAITGQGKTLGNAAVLSIRATINQHLAYLQTDLEKAEPKFVRAYLETQYEHLRAVASGGGSTKGALTCGFLRGMTVPRPPTIIEQQEIAEVLDALDRKIELLRSKRDVLDRLFKSLLHKLMTGEISIDDLDLSALPSIDGSAA
jgi:type I restriction enzyme S subunit